MLVKKKAAVTLVTPLIQGCEVCQRIFRPVCASDGVIFTIIIFIIDMRMIMMQ